MNAAAPSNLLGRGLYPLAEAARIVQLDRQTAARWASGNTFAYKGERRQSAGLVEFTLPPIAGSKDITFAELLTLRMVRVFRKQGLSLRIIKRVAEKAAADYEVQSPLATKRFRSDGRKIFLELKQETPANDGKAIPKHDLELIDILSGQRNFQAIVEPSLFSNLEWQDDWNAARWWPAGRGAGVVLDPEILFGAPRLDNSSLPTRAIAQAVVAEGGGERGVEAVASWYGIAGKQVQQAVVFETEWLSLAA